MPVSHGAPQPRAELIALGIVVRRHREDRRWSVQMLADESGVSRRTVINIESGRHSAGFDSLLDVAACLGTKLSMLIAESEVDEGSGDGRVASP